MKACILFTRSNKIGSKLIRAVTGEPVSHCAIYVPQFGFVWHATVPTVTSVSLKRFEEHHCIVYTNTVSITQDQLLHLRGLKGSPYGAFTLLYVGMRLLLRGVGISIPKADLRGVSGTFLCTEFVQTALGLENDPYMTPYKLYCELYKS